MKNGLPGDLLKKLPVVLRSFFGGEVFFDETERIYLAKDPKYAGAGFGFIGVREDGSWFAGEVAAATLFAAISLYKSQG